MMNNRDINAEYIESSTSVESLNTNEDESKTKKTPHIKEKFLSEELIIQTKAEIERHLGEDQLSFFEKILNHINYNRLCAPKTLLNILKKKNIQDARIKLFRFIELLSKLNGLDPMFSPIPIEIVYKEGKLKLIQTRKIYKKALGRVNLNNPSNLQLYPQTINTNYDPVYAKRIIKQKAPGLIYGNSDASFVHQIIDHYSSNGLALTKQTILGIFEALGTNFTLSKVVNALNKLKIQLEENCPSVILKTEFAIYYDKINDPSEKKENYGVKAISKSFYKEIESFISSSPIKIDISKFKDLLDIPEELNHTERSLKLLLFETMQYIKEKKLSDLNSSILIVLFFATFFNKIITPFQVFEILNRENNNEINYLKYNLNLDNTTLLIIENYAQLRRSIKNQNLYFLKLREKIEDENEDIFDTIATEINIEELEKISRRLEKIRDSINKMIEKEFEIREESFLIIDSLLKATENGLALTLQGINEEISLSNPNIVIREKDLFCNSIQNLLTKYQLAIKVAIDGNTESNNSFYLDKHQRKISLSEILSYEILKQSEKERDYLRFILDYLSKNKEFSVLAKETLSIINSSFNYRKSINEFFLQKHLNNLDIIEIDREKLQEIFEEIIEASKDTDGNPTIEVFVKDFRIQIKTTENSKNYINWTGNEKNCLSPKILEEGTNEFIKHSKSEFSNLMVPIINQMYLLKEFTIEDLVNFVNFSGIIVTSRQIASLITSIQNMNSVSEEISPIPLDIEENGPIKKLIVSKKKYLKALGRLNSTHGKPIHSLYPIFEKFEFDLAFFQKETKDKMQQLYLNNTLKFKVFNILAMFSSNGFKLSAGIITEMLNDLFEMEFQGNISTTIYSLKKDFENVFPNQSISLVSEGGLYFFQTKGIENNAEFSHTSWASFVEESSINELQKQYMDSLSENEEKANENTKIPKDLYEELNEWEEHIGIIINFQTKLELISIKDKATLSKSEIWDLFIEIQTFITGERSKSQKALDQESEAILFVLFKATIQGKGVSISQLKAFIPGLLSENIDFRQKFVALRKRINDYGRSKLKIKTEKLTETKTLKANIWYLELEN